MTLRDFGSWVGRMWDRIVSDLEIVVTSSPLDWPIWVFFAGFVLVFVIAPLVARKVLYEFRLYNKDEPSMGLGWCIGFTLLAAFFALGVMDLYVFQSMHEDPENETILFYIGSPILTIFFGFFAIVEWRKKIQVWRDSRSR